MKKILLLIIIVLIAVAGGAYYYFLPVLKPTTPEYVRTAENALAQKGTIVLAHFNVENTVKIEDLVYGEEDKLALPSDSEDSNKMLQTLLSEDFNIRKNLKHVLASIVITPKEPVYSVVLLGNFPSAKLQKAIKDNYIVRGAKGSSIMTFQQKDFDTCKMSDPISIQIKDDRIVISSPESISQIIKRLDSNAAAEIDLSKWNAYREGKIISAGILVPSKADQALSRGMLKMMAKGAVDKSQAVESLFFGLSANPFPPSIKLGTDITTTDHKWIDEVEKALEKSKDSFDEYAIKLPTINKLRKYFTYKISNNFLHMEVLFNKELLEDAVKIPSELISYAFSGFSSSSGSSKAAEQEQIIEADKVKKYDESVSIKSLKTFDPKADSFFKAGSVSGPFGISFTSAELNKDGLIEIEIAIKSNVIPNIAEDMFGSKEQAKIYVTTVKGQKGEELLANEECGKERNSAATNVKTGNAFIDGDWLAVLEGKKKVRLKKGKRLADIKSINGYIELNLPVSVVSKTLEAPFTDKAIEDSGFRILFKESDSGSIKYELSGDEKSILEVRALNAKKQYLASGWSSSSGRMFGKGKTVTKGFKGTINAVEVVYAVKRANNKYSFSIKESTPKFQNFKLDIVKVKASKGKEAFLAKFAEHDYEQYKKKRNWIKFCENKADQKDFAPFQFCIEKTDTIWNGGFSIQGKTFSPYTDSLVGNLSAFAAAVDTLGISKNGVKSVVNLKYVKDIILSNNQYGEVKYLGNSYMSIGFYEEHEQLKNAKITNVKGRYIVRLPKKLKAIPIKLIKLGNKVKSKSGWELEYVSISDGQIKLKVDGPRSKVVQLLAVDKNNKPIATNSVRFNEKDGDTFIKMQTSGMPYKVLLIYASEQDILEYPFDIAIENK